MKGVGDRFKKIRQTLNLSQNEFGEKLGLSSQGISNIEKEKSFLSLSGLEKLLDMEINLNYLIGGHGEMFNSPSSFDSFKEKVKEVLRDEGIIK